MSFPCIHSHSADEWAETQAEDEALWEYAAEHGISVEQAERELERQRHEDEMDRAQGEADWEAMWP